MNKKGSALNAQVMVLIIIAVIAAFFFIRFLVEKLGEFGI